MRLDENFNYLKNLDDLFLSSLNWDLLQGKSFFISGAGGMVSSFFIDALMRKKKTLHCQIYALGRNEEKIKNRFSSYWNDDCFHFVKGDINEPLSLDIGDIDFVLHAASNTHPVAYSTDPIGTITTNVIGTKNMLDFAYEHHCSRFIFLSSVEVYGENRGDQTYFDEEYTGYLNCNTLRAGYPEGKRCGEALCQAYIKQKNMDIVIPRLARTYGPTMLMSDTKAISQFIKKTIADEDIVLKSQGFQNYSYTHVLDAVSGILYCMMKGKNGEAYNIADEHSDITLKDLALYLAQISNRTVVFELPSDQEALGYSKATKALLDGSKLKQLGWQPFYDIKSGLSDTVKILKECIL